VIASDWRVLRWFRLLPRHLRVALYVTWSVGLASLLITAVLGAFDGISLAFADSATGIITVLALANVACGVAICAITHPGAIAIFTNTGYVILVGLWTSAVLLTPCAAGLGGIVALATGDLGALGAMGIALGVILVAHLIGLLLYCMVGEFLVAAVLVVRARLSDQPAPFDRLASGLMLTLVIVTGGAAGLAGAQGDPDGGASRGETLARASAALITFDGTPQQQLWSWVARIALVGILISGAWLATLSARGFVTRRGGGSGAKRPGRHEAD
jgi:hypothetical protein